MLLTESEAARDLEVSRDAVRRLVEQGKLLAVEVNVGEKKKDYRIVSEGLEAFKKGLSLDETKAIMKQLVLSGGHCSDLRQAISESEQRMLKSNPLSKIRQLIYAGGQLDEDSRKIMDAYHCIKNELLFRSDESDLQKVTEDLQSRYPEMDIGEIHKLLADVRGWMKEMGL